MGEMNGHEHEGLFKEMPWVEVRGEEDTYTNRGRSFVGKQMGQVKREEELWKK